MPLVCSQYETRLLLSVVFSSAGTFYMSLDVDSAVPEFAGTEIATGRFPDMRIGYTVMTEQSARRDPTHRVCVSSTTFVIGSG